MSLVRVIVRAHSLATLGLYACCASLSSTDAAIILSLAVVSVWLSLILAGAAGENSRVAAWVRPFASCLLCGWLDYVLRRFQFDGRHVNTSLPSILMRSLLVGTRGAGFSIGINKIHVHSYILLPGFAVAAGQCACRGGFSSTIVTYIFRLAFIPGC